MMIIRTLIFCGLCQSASADLTALNAEDMRNTTGGDGVALAVDFALNVDSSNNPLCSTSGAASTTIPCRIGLQTNNRTNAAGDGEWLVLKNIYGRITIPRLTLDATTATYTDKSGITQNIPALFLTMQDKSGTPVPFIIKNFNIQAISMETDQSPTPTVSQMGYMTPDESGFISLRINDTAGVTMRGGITVFPCQSNHPGC